MGLNTKSQFLLDVVRPSHVDRDEAMRRVSDWTQGRTDALQETLDVFSSSVDSQYYIP